VKLYRTTDGCFVEHDDGSWYSFNADWTELIARENLTTVLKIQEASCPREPAPDPARFLAPITEQEVWAAGVTYYRSRSARMDESQAAGGRDFYDRVYHAERPELFFKATPHRVVGLGGAVRIRGDSRWNVPEPELTLLLSPSGKLLGYTIGNDMSSRDIEGENPLYLPQAKVYDGSCALGPCILVASEPLAAETAIQLEIEREGHVVFSDGTTLAQMKRSPEELAEYLFRENTFPNGCFLLTGTGIVPPDDFTLAHGDEIRITIAPIGTLSNRVE
jgi:2-dehydro-3-deoxy-D-arabinonate dehydratase